MIDTITIIWILDILDIIPILDTTYPINTIAWLLIWFAISPSPKKKNKDIQ
jgi:hypothetical protein